MALLGLLLAPHEAAAQLDPLLYLKRTKPNVLVSVDTSVRMQLDTNGDYRDDNVYKYGDPILTWETGLGIVPGVNVDTRYRRKYVGLQYINSGGNRFSADHIEIVGDREATYGMFDEYTRMSIARRALIEAVNRNSNVARFGLLRTRQTTPAY